jgi:hypothetical protein
MIKFMQGTNCKKVKIMKKLSFCFLFGITILFSTACKNNVTSNSPNCVLSESDSLDVIKKVLEITDEFANANNRLDYDRLVACWAYTHPDFIAIENLDFLNPSGLYERVKAFYTNTELDTTNLKWIKRQIVPVSLTSAHIYGEYEIFFKYKSNDKTRLYEEGNYYAYYSAILSKIDGKWKILRFHESYKMVK